MLESEFGEFQESDFIRAIIEGKPLYLPQPPQLNTELDYVGIYITHEEVFGSPLSREELQRLLSSLSLRDCMLIISKLIILLSEDDGSNQEVQSLLRDSFFPEDIRVRIKSIQEQSPKGNRVVFFDRQLLVLAKLVILYAKDEPPNSFEGGKRSIDFIKALLGVTDLFGALYKEREKLSGQPSEAVAGSLIPALWLAHEEMFAESIIRHRALFLTLPKLEQFQPGRCPDYIDLEGEFQKETGVSIVEFMSFVLLIYAQFASQSILKKTPGEVRWAINPKSPFKSTKIPWEKLLPRLSIKPAQAKNLIADNQHEPGFEWNFLTFKHYPLIQLSENILSPISLRFLKEKITQGVYWTILDGLRQKEDSAGLERFTRYFGQLFELYVVNVLKRIYPPSLLGKRAFYSLEYKGTSKQLVKASDAIVVYGEDLVLIECKAKRIQALKTAIPGDLKAFDQDVRSLVIKSAGQLDRVINDFKAGLFDLEGITASKVKRYYPIVVTPEPWPQNSVIWKRIFQEVEDSKKLQASDIERICIITIEELELLEYLTEQGRSLVNIVKSWLSHPTLSFYSLGQYLGILSPANVGHSKHMAGAFAEFSSEVKALVSGSNK